MKKSRSKGIHEGSYPNIPDKFWGYALWLALFTIFYNFAEGLVSIYFGAQGETLTLFGFGIDSFIEVMSGIGILAMVLRIRRDTGAPRSAVERTALRITGASFYLLAAGLAATAVYDLYTAHKPVTTLPGFDHFIDIHRDHVGIGTGQTQNWAPLNSAPILADANCSMVCIYMSVVLLASSLVYQLTGLGFVDSARRAGLDLFFDQRRQRGV